MDVYHDYTLVCGTSEGDATSDDGRQVWFCFVTDLDDPSEWKLGISESPETDILSGLVAGTFGAFYREGKFDTPKTELEIMKFIERHLSGYFQENGTTTKG